MCGLGGILVHSNRAAVPGPPELAVPDSWLDALDRLTRFRGPDGHGRYRGRHQTGSGLRTVALVHSRLSIIDHQGGRQPMVDPSPSAEVAVVFNGAIYNHHALRAELVARGAVFRTDHSDTEVLIHGWRAWGHGLWPRLDGMFAVALWDQAAGQLVLARDPAGEKPLYYTHLRVHQGRADGGDEAVVFASTVPAVEAAARAVDPASGTLPVDPARLSRWVEFGFDLHPPLRGVHAIPPAHTLDAPGGTPTPYWRPPVRGKAGTLSEARLAELLSRAIASRLEADVPLGCFLSGGVDSSVVAALALRTLGPRGLDTFTVRMPDPRLDESEHAKAIADHLGTRHHTLEVETRPDQDLGRIISQIGLPLGDSSLLPTCWVSRAARPFAKVCLTGDGGDELFGGYDRYAAARWLHRARELIATWPDDLPGRLPRRLGSRLVRLIRAARRDGYPDLLRIGSPLITPRESPVHDVGAIRAWAGLGANPDADPLTYDFLTYLPGDLMLKADSASMSVPLEARSPLLAGEVRDAALAQPLSTLMPGGRRKALLRSVAGRWLPEPALRRPKQGFAIPIGAWFRDDFGGLRALLMDLLCSADPFPGVPEFASRSQIDRLLTDHQDRRADHGQRLFGLLTLSIWARSRRA